MKTVVLKISVGLISILVCIAIGWGLDIVIRRVVSVVVSLPPGVGVLLLLATGAGIAAAWNIGSVIVDVVGEAAEEKRLDRAKRRRN